MIRRVLSIIRHPSNFHDARHELRRRLRGEPPLPDGPMQRVLVLCHGNICRSPYAEVLLAELLPGAEVRSAGLEAADGHDADEAAARAAVRAGHSLQGHRSHPLDDADLEWAHLVLVMGGGQWAEVVRRSPWAKPKLRMLGDFLPEPPHLVKDPWGQPDAVFDEIFARVAEAVRRLAGRIEGDTAQ